MKNTITFIGIVHSPYTETDQAPHQNGDSLSEIEIYQQFSEGLQDIDGFSHLIVLYWLHQATGYRLLVKTPWDEKQHGLFSTRTPNRVNPLALSVVTLMARTDNVLQVKGLDAIDRTPVVDIKPYIPGIDAHPNARSGWRACFH